MSTPALTSHQAALQDPSLINAARDLYATYLNIHDSRSKEPAGVVLHQHSYRGQLSFRSAPVLLPEECFVSFQQLQTGVAN